MSIMEQEGENGAHDVCGKQGKVPLHCHTRWITGSCYGLQDYVMDNRIMIWITGLCYG